MLAMLMPKYGTRILEEDKISNTAMSLSKGQIQG